MSYSKKTTSSLLAISPLDIFLGSLLGLGTIIWISRQFRSSTFKYDPSNEKSNKSGEQSKAVSTGPERNFVKLMKQQNRQVIFFYGSQTGTAEDYASRLAKECSQKYGVSAMTADIELYDMTYLDAVPSDNLVVFVMATYGEGEPTDNSVEFWELLTGEEPEFSESTTLENLRYIVFGLGNKTYEHYNAVARVLDTRLSELGGKRIAERGEGDDDASLEEDFLAWQEDMWPAFCDALGVDESNAQSGPRQAMFGVQELDAVDRASVFLGELGEWTNPEQLLQQTVVHDAKHPYQAPISLSHDLFQQSTDRHCLHLEIDLSKSNLTYHTGDHIAIWPTNNEVEVERFASVLGLSEKLDTPIMVEALDSAASKKHPFPVPTTYRALFRHYLDICAPASRQTLMSLVEYAPTEASKEALRQLATDKDAYRAKVGEAMRNLAEVLELCQGHDDEGTTNVAPGFFSTVPFDLIVESVSRLQPRYYSISSSSLTSSKSVSVTAVTLSYQPTKGEERTVYGVNTNYLWRIHAPEDDAVPLYDLNGPRNTLKNKKVPVHIRRSQFKLPRNTKSPIIMVGPGTGVAPFRGFVHERVHQKQHGKEVGPTVLFYGCRHSEQDFLYKEEWPQLFEILGEGSEMITAFSRETDKKVYVQHRLKEHGERMWDLLQKNASLYICGDAKNMARDVQQTFIEFAQTYGGKTEQEAHDYIKNLRNSGRYQEDVWS
ncbi:hypothetical protein BDA99DRAFT_513913 [Phascolomyces articulosus]|uniref:NADPH--cytochrome P450 reductase n=1 Tax=Phascolomyces articulosus TaxID=60185 RepID=A0AAD5PD59_9FUNG|nr:hypothetical protein BDA99DRAFT_513913 [Phascolomyces articulosus]